MGLLAEYGRDQTRRGLRPKTIATRRRILVSLEAGIEGPIERATTEQIERWLDSCRLARRSRYTYISAVASFFDFARRRGVKRDPTAEIVRPRLSRLVPRPAVAEDIEYAIRLAEPQMAAWLCLCAFQGFRCCEIAVLQREHVLEDRDPPLLLIADGKGGHQAMLTLNEQVEKSLRNYGLPRAGYLFLSRDGDPFKPATIGRYISTYLRSLDIDATAHQLRHLFGTLLWSQTKDLRDHHDPMGWGLDVHAATVNANRAPFRWRRGRKGARFCGCRSSAVMRYP